MNFLTVSPLFVSFPLPGAPFLFTHPSPYLTKSYESFLCKVFHNPENVRISCSLDIFPLPLVDLIRVWFLGISCPSSQLDLRLTKDLCFIKFSLCSHPSTEHRTWDPGRFWEIDELKSKTENSLNPILTFPVKGLSDWSLISKPLCLFFSLQMTCFLPWCHFFQEAFQVWHPSYENFFSICMNALITLKCKCLFACSFPHQSEHLEAVGLAQGRYLVVVNNYKMLAACSVCFEHFIYTNLLRCQNTPWGG